jgi:AraC-like DNA-binding protein
MKPLTKLEVNAINNYFHTDNPKKELAEYTDFNSESNANRFFKHYHKHNPGTLMQILKVVEFKTSIEERKLIELKLEQKHSDDFLDELSMRKALEGEKLDNAWGINFENTSVKTYLFELLCLQKWEKT